MRTVSDMPGEFRMTYPGLVALEKTGLRFLLNLVVHLKCGAPVAESAVWPSLRHTTVMGAYRVLS